MAVTDHLLAVQDLHLELHGDSLMNVSWDRRTRTWKSQSYGAIKSWNWPMAYPGPGHLVGSRKHKKGFSPGSFALGFMKTLKNTAHRTPCTSWWPKVLGFCPWWVVSDWDPWKWAQVYAILSLCLWTTESGHFLKSTQSGPSTTPWMDNQCWRDSAGLRRGCWRSLWKVSPGNGMCSYHNCSL